LTDTGLQTIFLSAESEVLSLGVLGEACEDLSMSTPLAGVSEMKLAVMGVTIALLFGHNVTYAGCIIQDEQRVTIGDSTGIEGVCSNNGLAISCQFIQGQGITCGGPIGIFSGDDLNSLIVSACGCSTQEEENPFQ
jgi:hypothetical protein